MLVQSSSGEVTPFVVPTEGAGYAPLKVVLPPDLRRFYREAGYQSPTEKEARTTARLRVRTAGFVAFLSAPPAIAGHPGFRLEKLGTVLIKDLSRTGIGVLYHEQIFPGERFCVTLQHRQIEVVAVRCRRLSNCCFETGSQIQNVASLDSEEA